MRSSSVAMYWMPMSGRRSRATGCWVAMTMKICSRICLKSSLRYWSCERTFSAAGPSRRRSASSEASICASTTVPMRTTDSRRLASSLSNVRRGNWLAEASGDVGLSSRVARRVEQVGGGGGLDQLAVPALCVPDHHGGQVRRSLPLWLAVGYPLDRLRRRQPYHARLHLY